MDEVKRFINHSRFQNNFQFSTLRFLHLVGSKSHCRAVPAVPSPIRCASNLIFIDDVSFKLLVSHMVYFTVVSKTKIVFCFKLCFY